MEQKTLFEQLGGTYSQQGDYFLPDIRLPVQPEFEIGVWSIHRRQYLKHHHHRVKYYNMLTQCVLYPHLAEVDAQAVRMEENIVTLFVEQESVTELLKANDMMAWVYKMNSIHARANEIIRRNLDRTLKQNLVEKDRYAIQILIRKSFSL